MPERDVERQEQDPEAAETHLVPETPPIDPGPIEVDFVMKELFLGGGGSSAGLDVDPDTDSSIGR